MRGVPVLLWLLLIVVVASLNACCFASHSFWLNILWLPSSSPSSSSAAAAAVSDAVHERVCVCVCGVLRTHMRQSCETLFVDSFL